MWTCMLSASYTTRSSMVLVYNDPPHNQSIDQQLAPYKTIHYFSLYYDVHSDYLKFVNFYGYYTCTDFVMHVILVVIHIVCSLALTFQIIPRTLESMSHVSSSVNWRTGLNTLHFRQGWSIPWFFPTVLCVAGCWYFKKKALWMRSPRVASVGYDQNFQF